MANKEVNKDYLRQSQRDYRLAFKLQVIDEVEKGFFIGVFVSEYFFTQPHLLMESIRSYMIICRGYFWWGIKKVAI